MSDQKITIRELYSDPEKYAGQVITVDGWARQLRIQKKFGFIQINDGTYFKNLQIVVESEKSDNYDEIKSQNISTAFEITGELVLTPEAKQPFELKADVVKIIGESTSEYPLQPKSHTPEFLRSIAHLRPRSNLFSAVFRIRSEAAFAIHEFFNQQGFMYVHTPIITSSDAEGAGDMFRVTTLDPKNPPLTEDGDVDFSEDFFGKASFLTVSGQLNGEAFAQAYRNIYTFGPTFRSEHSNTQRHAAEFWMIEPEIAFAGINEAMDLAEAMLKHIINHTLDRCRAELEFLNETVYDGLIDRLEKVAKSDFAKVTYTDAIKILQESGKKFEFPVEWGSDLQTEHERYLTEVYFQGPVFVTDYPKDIKAFYMHINPDGKTVAAFDCLVPEIGEIIGGSQREERYDVLVNEIEARGMNIDNYDWYLDLRKYGSTPHAGYGLGFERIIMYLTGVSNIRDVIPFPRTTGNAEF
ncbi:asparagine--tRNA ligase [Fastidiosipila sanguinis]|uniref:Asparagine--tRNA ligase n=1 Tax=Fastidiosipila sanguinis TaxID=236753 RepID=A0A2S0KML8_9FIRM|nr:asparagine--tRNA ligase [Fastidiosipila sanguinis]AVM42281.1 asparagine--tRNA ligase [Fastidiosipila sanguinis]